MAALQHLVCTDSHSLTLLCCAPPHPAPLHHVCLQGKLCALVQLAHSMSFLTGGLAGIMAAYRPAAAAAAASQAPPGASKSAMLEAAATPHAAAAAAAAAQPSELSVSSLMGAVAVAVDELPVWESPEVEQVGRGRGRRTAAGTCTAACTAAIAYLTWLAGCSSLQARCARCPLVFTCAWCGGCMCCWNYDHHWLL